MLISLHIENVAVIKKIDIDFASGFTALTGETGAGKSIIIDSIGLLLGRRAEKELIRNGESALMVSGLFGGFTDEALTVFTELGVAPDEEGNLFIQRNLSIDGKSQIKIGGRTVSISLLKLLAPHLITVHGQNDTRSLADPSSHLAIIDAYASNKFLLKEYQELYAEYTCCEKELEGLYKKEHERERLVQMYEYQINDIDAMALHDGEEEELVERKMKIKNSERLTKYATFTFKALKGSEKGSVSYLLDKSAQALSQISDCFPKCQEFSEKLNDFLYQIDDIAENVYSIIDDVTEDPDDALNEIESRLDKISKLKRKYGLTVKDILNFREKTAEELEKIKNADQIIEKLEKQKEDAYKKALSVANKLHKARRDASKLLEKTVKETLDFLDMPGVTFYVDIKEEFKNGNKVLNKHGTDNVELFISANKGAEAQPLAKIASGGELARIMLAIKSALANDSEAATLIFDEIDAGVSGKTARKIGIKMLALSKNCQIFSVTHSAQIASLADTHLLIKKTTDDDSTVTTVAALDNDGRVAELSRILGGIKVTESQKKAAEDMLKEKEVYN